MKKETLIKVIDEEFGDDKEFSWLIDVVQKAIIKNDSRITQCTNAYEDRASTTKIALKDLYNLLIDSEKQELKDGVTIPHNRK